MFATAAVVVGKVKVVAPTTYRAVATVECRNGWDNEFGLAWRLAAWAMVKELDFGWVGLVASPAKTTPRGILSSN